MTIAIVALVVLLVVVGAAWAARHVKHPEQASTHGEPGRESDSERFYAGVDRPAGPDAEDPIGPAHPSPEG